MYRLLLTLFLFVPAMALACIDLNNDPQPGSLLWGRVLPGSAVYLDGDALSVAGDGTFVFGLNRDARGEIALRVEGSESCEQRYSLAAREYRIQRIEGVPQKTVTPGPEHQARIQREQVKINKARSTSAEFPYFAGGFDWPATGPISGVYGSQRYYNGTPGRPHWGIDVAMPTGTPVTAPGAGIVVLAEDDLFYSGGTIILDHGMGVFSSFLHMSKVHAAVGQKVAIGDLLGEIGASGRATGPHLDWRIRWQNNWVDPQLLVPPMP